MEKNKMMLKRIYIFFDTLFGIVLGLILMSQLLYYVFGRLLGEMYEGIYAMLPCYVCLFTMLFFSFSLIRIVVTTECAPLRESFWEKEIDASLKSRLLFLIRQKEFWLKACIIALIYLLLPLDLTFKALADALQCGSSFTDKLKALAIFFPILLTVAVLAHLRAYKDWSKNKDPKKYSKEAINKDAVKICLIYALGSAAFLIGFPYIMIIVLLVPQLLTIGRVIGIAILLTIPTIYRLIRAYFKRRTCVRQLRKICDQKGYILSEIAHPYSALFRFPEGESF